MLKKGDVAPDFTLPADDGSTVTLSQLRGKKVLIYFYPKDDTPGCTTQACDLRDHMISVKGKGALVFGISPDSIASHLKFKQKFDLNFPLLADEGHKVAEAYGAWGEKSNYGKTSMGIIRSSFLIDEKGQIAEEWRNVKAKEHMDWVTENLSA